MTAYTRKFKENTTMSLMVNNNNKQILKNYNKIWKKVEKPMKINFESKTIYGDDGKYIKTKTKIYAGSIITNFHNKKIPKQNVNVNAPCKCLSMVMLDSVIKVNKKYYPQTFLEECKYAQEKIKIESYIDDDDDDDDFAESQSNDETKSNIDNDEYDE